MAYIFSRTSGDAQIYLHPQYIKDLADPFISKKEIISYLFFIYKDLFKI